jgi:8-amino-7-oxononanoate synthase
LQRAHGLIAALRREGFDTEGSASQIVPVVFGKNEDTLKAAWHLQHEGFAVRAIRPPTVPVGRARLRLSLTIQIAEQELKRLVHCLTKWRERHPLTTTMREA